MPRSVNSSILTALLADEVKIFYAIELDFYNGATNTATPVYFWTGVGDLVENSKTYVGAGDLLSISGIDEVSDLKAAGISAQLSGVPSDLVNKALSSEYHGRDAIVYFGIHGSSFLTEIFSGYMDQMEIQEGSDTSTIVIKVENKLVDLERARVARFTSSYQKSRDIANVSSDKGLDFVASMQDKKVPWGREADA